MPLQQPKYELGNVVIALDTTGGPIHFNVLITTPFGDMAQGSRHGIDFTASQDELQALADARGVAVDLFDELLESITEFIAGKHSQVVDKPAKRRGPP